jgi:MFS transporter, DHA2 family, methylenomycin A resistance protein
MASAMHEHLQVRANDLARQSGAMLILLTTSLGMLVAQIDTSVVNLAIKQIGSDLDASMTALQWVADVYNLLFASLMLTGGRLADRFGRRRVFIIGLTLFALGSVICAGAPNVATLITGRAITGLGAALELPTSLSILTLAYADAQTRARAIGIWASCNGLGFIIGPTTGGVIVDMAGWRLIFLLIVPICVAALTLAVFVVPESSDRAGPRFDVLGQFLAVIAVGTLAFGVIEGPRRGFASTIVVAALTVCVASALAFRQLEKRAPVSLWPLFANQAFSVSLAVAALMTFGMYAMLFLVPFYLQLRGASAFAVALDLLPMSVTFVLVSQWSGMLTNRLGPKVTMSVGMTCLGSGLLLLSRVAPPMNFLGIAMAMFVLGVGLGLNAGPVLAVAIANAPRSHVGTASGLVNTARMIGATLGVAALGAVFAAVAGATGAGTLARGLRAALLCGAASELVGAVLAFRFVGRDSHRSLAVQSEPTVR